MEGLADVIAASWLPRSGDSNCSQNSKNAHSCVQELGLARKMCALQSYVALELRDDDSC